jgi:cytochrome c
MIFSCKKEVQKSENRIPEIASLEKGQQLFQENNCAACHQTNQKVVGPSLEQIATIYKKKNASLVSFLKQEAEPVVDSSQYETMKINLELTKVMTDEELKSLEIYILNCSK